MVVINAVVVISVNVAVTVVEDGGLTQQIIVVAIVFLEVIITVVTAVTS